MNFKDVMLDDLDEVFFDTEDGFAETIEFLTAGVEVSAIVEYLQDPGDLQGGMAARANVYLKKSDAGNIAPMQEMRFAESIWIIERIEAADNLVVRLLVRSKERMACV